MLRLMDDWAKRRADENSRALENLDGRKFGRGGRPKETLEGLRYQKKGVKAGIESEMLKNKIY